MGGETGSSNSLTAATDSQTRHVLFTDHTEIDNTEETFWSDEPMIEILICRELLLWSNLDDF